jgi:hypothetical protein
MVAMDGFDHLLNWKLKRGSHYFPAKTEAPASTSRSVAAGFEYRDRSARADESAGELLASDLRLAMYLNDQHTDQERQRLLPYGHALGCADHARGQKRSTESAYI